MIAPYPTFTPVPINLTGPANITDHIVNLSAIPTFSKAPVLMSTIDIIYFTGEHLFKGGGTINLIIYYGMQVVFILCLVWIRWKIHKENQDVDNQ